MPSQKNIDQVQELSEKLSGAKAVVLTDYTGLSVSQQQKLRKNVSKAGGQLLVAKNRLFKLALSETNKGKLPSQVEESLQGPTAFLFAFEDELGPIKALVQFSLEHDSPKTKIGLILKPEDRILTTDQIEKLAKLPSKDQLLLQLVSMLHAPQYRLVKALNGNLTKLVGVLRALKSARESN
jgi:large subunit ribosomal protein L10